MNKISQRIEIVATLVNAFQYEAQTDKWVFCLELLGLSTSVDGDNVCDRAVERLERRFEAIISIHAANAPHYANGW